MDGAYKLIINTRLDKEAGVYVAKCEELDIYSQGATVKEAIDCCKGAISMYLKRQRIRSQETKKEDVYHPEYWKELSGTKKGSEHEENTDG